MLLNTNIHSCCRSSRCTILLGTGETLITVSLGVLYYLVQVRHWFQFLLVCYITWYRWDINYSSRKCAILICTGKTLITVPLGVLYYLVQVRHWLQFQLVCYITWYRWDIDYSSRKCAILLGTGETLTYVRLWELLGIHNLKRSQR